MRIRRLSIAVLAMGLAFAPAAAQESTPAAPVKPTAINVQTSVTYEGSTATPEDDMALQAKARAALYRIAGSECATISETLGVDCKIGQIQISTRPTAGRAPGAGSQGGIVAEGRFSFAVTPRQ